LSNIIERTYTDGLLTRIDYPTGNSETFTYNTDGQLELGKRFAKAFVSTRMAAVQLK